MKKTVTTSVFLAITLCINTLVLDPMTAFAECDHDFNSDGLVNGDDVLLIMNRYSEIAVEKDDIISNQVIRDKVNKNADLNGDGRINGCDAILLANSIRENNICGDVNCDGIIDVRDASYVLSFYARHSLEEYDWQIGSDISVSVLGDFDKNEVIDARDAAAILTTYAKASVK